MNLTESGERKVEEGLRQYKQMKDDIKKYDLEGIFDRFDGFVSIDGDIFTFKEIKNFPKYERKITVDKEIREILQEDYNQLYNV